jgi:hypothetical protein
MHPISLVGFLAAPRSKQVAGSGLNTAMKVWTYLAIAAGMAAIVLNFGAARDAQRRCDSMRLGAVDRKLQLIMDHLGIAEPYQYLPKVTAHLAQGRKSNRQGISGRHRCRPGRAKEAVGRIARDRDL